MLLFVALLRFGVLFEVTAVQAHVTVESGNVLESTLTQIAFDGSDGSDAGGGGCSRIGGRSWTGTPAGFSASGLLSGVHGDGQVGLDIYRAGCFKRLLDIVWCELWLRLLEFRLYGMNGKI